MAKPLPVTSLPESQIIGPDSGLDADFFFEENKGKILGVIIFLLLALCAWLFYQHQQNETRKEQSSAFYNAKSSADWQALIAKYPGTIVAGNAQLLLADKLRDENKLDEALAVLSDFTKTAGSHPLIAQGWLSYAGTLEAKGDAAKAAQTYGNIAGQYSSTEAAPAALASQARLVRKSGDNKKAREIYENIVQRFPTSVWSEEAKQEIDRLPE